jgi:hypothetical protein
MERETISDLSYELVNMAEEGVPSGRLCPLRIRCSMAITP